MKIILLILIFFLTACSVKNAPVLEDTPVYEASVTFDSPIPDKIPYTVYTQTKKYNLSLYEPEKGCYAGAYILSSDITEIVDFEAEAGNHAIYLYDYKMGDVFPIRWLLSCMAETKTPYIVVNPQNSYNPFDMEALSELVDEIGRFYVPIFVDLYPNADMNLYDPEEYKDFFKQAYSLFKKRASNAAVVFSTEYEQSAAAYLYYPGNDFTDWVGINIKIGAIETPGDIYKNIDNIYYRFQKDKPMMISSLAVSHISGENHIYRTEEAANNLLGFYSTIISKYPRIKGINYLNINCIENDAEFSNSGLLNDNYLITDEKKLLDTYKEKISKPEFVETIDYQSHTDLSGEYFTSPFPAYLYENEMYINTNTILYDLNIKGFNSYESEKISIEGEDYYNLKLLEKNRLKKIFINEAERMVYLNEY